MTVKDFFDQLLLGNGSVITSNNIYWLNQQSLTIYNKENLSKEDVEQLKYIIMCCNILYNRTDMNIQVIEDGFYDLLLEKYRIYDKNFQVGSAVVDFKNSIQNDVENPRRIAECPLIFNKPIQRDEFRQEIHNEIMQNDKYHLNIYDHAICPIEFSHQDTITKRTHNTEHNHPSLVGTLDKAKFIFIKDAIEAGVENDPTVKVLERDFFQEHIKRGIIFPNQEIGVVVELKYDGISVEADCDTEVRSARTRGDTGIGVAADITPILQGYSFKHGKQFMVGQKPIGVKFEAIMTKSNLEKFNQLRGKKYANCRTAIIGLFGASDANQFKDLITLVPLALDRNDVPPYSITNRLEEISFLNQIFISHGEPLRYCYFEGTVSEVLYCIKAFWDEAIIARDYLNFMYDGIVVSYTDERIRDTLGRENYINKYSMAVKFNPLEKQTIFRGYTFEVGQHGQITPMIHYDPVEFLGTIHTKSTGSSFKRFNELNLKYGDYISVTYRNDVMPYVSKYNCEANRKNPNNPVPFITTCPICGHELQLSNSLDTMYCPNRECPGRTVQRMVNMLDKLNIKGFADASIVALKVNHLHELCLMNLDTMIERLGEANGEKLYTAINQLMNTKTPDYILMGSLGFTSIAKKKWQDILNNITLRDLYHLYQTSSNEREFLNMIFSKIPGEVTAYTVSHEFQYFEKDIVFILQMFQYIDSYGKANSYKKQIRFTGVRNKQLSELLCNNGYDADDESSAGKKTDILLVPHVDYQSAKTKNISSSCKIVPIQEFIDHMEKYIGEKLM